MASKRGKGKTSRPDKSRIAAQRRSQRGLYPPDFQVNLPIASADVLAEITPLPPKWTCDKGSLTDSPARIWLGLAGDEGGEESGDSPKDMVARWPYRIANPGKKAGPWVCLALLAHETKMGLDDFARHQVSLEDRGLLIWSGEHNVYVLRHDLSGSDEEKMEKLDRVWQEMSNESAEERAQRRWIRPQVVAVPSEE